MFFILSEDSAEGEGRAKTQMMQEEANERTSLLPPSGQRSSEQVETRRSYRHSDSRRSRQKHRSSRKSQRHRDSEITVPRNNVSSTLEKVNGDVGKETFDQADTHVLLLLDLSLVLIENTKRKRTAVVDADRSETSQGKKRTLPMDHRRHHRRLMITVSGPGVVHRCLRMNAADSSLNGKLRLGQRLLPPDGSEKRNSGTVGLDDTLTRNLEGFLPRFTKP